MLASPAQAHAASAPPPPRWGPVPAASPSQPRLFIIFNAKFIIVNAKFILFNAQLIIFNRKRTFHRCRAPGIQNSSFFNTEFIILNTKFIILNTKFIIFSYRIHHFLIQNSSFFHTEFIILNTKFIIYNTKTHSVPSTCHTELCPDLVTPKWSPQRRVVAPKSSFSRKESSFAIAES